MNTPITSTTRLSDLLAYAEELARNKQDFKGKPCEFSFTPEGLLTSTPKQSTLFGLNVFEGMTAARLTDHAMKQACTKLGAAYDLGTLPADYMFTLQQQAPALFTENMNGAIERMPADRGWTVRTYQDEARAVLSNEYLVFDNTDMLKLLNDVLETDGTEHRISTRAWVSVNNMSVDVLFKDIETGRGDGNGSFSVGVRIRNGEIGDWSGGVYPIAKRTSCDNSIAFDGRAESFTFKHFGRNTLATKRVMLKSAMGEILPFSFNIIENLIQAEEKELPKFSDIVNGLGFKHGWSESFVGSVFAGSEGRYSLAGLVNGVTFAAHTQAPTPEAMTEAEFLGGALLFDKAGNMLQEAVAIHDSRTAREAAKAARSR